jgi:cytochrome c biogenesis protein CcmG/thiol:disulfide interchange protein DsbE
MGKAIYLLPLVLFFALAGYFAVPLLKPDYDPNTLPSALIDMPAPEFDLIGLDGHGTLAADSLKGQVVLINFFASWCVPCRLEHPLLMRLAKEEKLPLYGIAYKDNVEDTERLLAQTGDPYRRIGVDRDGRVGIDFGVYGVPETYVIDKSGHIRKRFVGPLTAEAVDKELLPLLKELNHS